MLSRVTGPLSPKSVSGGWQLADGSCTQAPDPDPSSLLPSACFWRSLWLVAGPRAPGPRASRGSCGSLQSHPRPVLFLQDWVPVARSFPRGRGHHPNPGDVLSALLAAKGCLRTIPAAPGEPNSGDLNLLAKIQTLFASEGTFTFI